MGKRILENSLDLVVDSGFTGACETLTRHRLRIWRRHLHQLALHLRERLENHASKSLGLRLVRRSSSHDDIMTTRWSRFVITLLQCSTFRQTQSSSSSSSSLLDNTSLAANNPWWKSSDRAGSGHRSNLEHHLCKRRRG